MNTISKYERHVAAMTAVVTTMFSMVIELAHFVTCMATMAFAVDELSLTTIIIMFSCAAVPTFWLAYRLHREIRYHDRTAAVSSLLIRQLWAFVTCLRVPAMLLSASMTAGAMSLDPAGLWAIAVPVGIWMPQIVRWLLRDRLRPTEIIRGTRLLTPSQVRAATATTQRGGAGFLDWCGLPLSEQVFASGHFCLVGAVASGKTVSMRLLMQSLLPRIRRGSNWRAIIFDAKQDMISILGGMKLHVPVLILNPFDSRGVAWHLASDITTPATALQAAAILIQEEKDGVNAFFIKAARDLLANTFIALHLTRPGKWTLADVVLILSDTKRAKRLLSSLRQTAHAARELFERDPRVLANIQSTISAHMAMLRPIAALWARSKHKISLTQWVNSECILVLGNDESLRAPMDAINRVIFQRITELVLAQSESRTRRTFCFLDECKEIGRLDCLPRLLTKGRTKGVRTVLAFQDIEGMRAVYGDHLAHEIVGMCANKAFLRTDCYETAKWACQIIGEIEQREWTRSITRGSNKSTSQSEHIQKREAILPAQIMQLPLARDGQYEGFFVTPGLGIYHRTVDFAHRLRPLGNVANFSPRPPEDQYLIDDTPLRSSLDDIGPITDGGDDNDPYNPFPDDDDCDLDSEP